MRVKRRTGRKRDFIMIYDMVVETHDTRLVRSPYPSGSWNRRALTEALV
jgi:hypothetical protein